MAVKGSFVTLFFLLTAFFAGVRANGACTEADITALGFNAGTPSDEQIKKLALSTSVMRKVRKASFTLTAPGDLPKITKKLEKEFTKVGLTGVNSACIDCFAGSTQCVTKHCKSQCINEFSPNCRKCIKEHCKDGFSKCVGLETIDPAEHKSQIEKAAKAAKTA